MIAIILLSIVCGIQFGLLVITIKRLTETIETSWIKEENNISMFADIGKKVNAINYELSVINNIINKPKKPKAKKAYSAQ